MDLNCLIIVIFRFLCTASLNALVVATGQNTFKLTTMAFAATDLNQIPSPEPKANCISKRMYKIYGMKEDFYLSHAQSSLAVVRECWYQKLTRCSFYGI